MIEIKMCYKRGYPACHKVAFSVTDIYNISKALMNLNSLKDTLQIMLFTSQNYPEKLLFIITLAL